MIRKSSRLLLLFALVFCSGAFVSKPTSAQTYTILHSFADGTVNHDGLYPSASLVQGGDGSFYGTTQRGGSTAAGTATGFGTMFKITPSGVETVLYNFGDGTIQNDGIYPESNLVLGSDGNFYGTAEQGGYQGGGTVFKITPAGMETVLHRFGDGTVQNDGATATAGLVLGSDGNFYGTTSQGGSAGSGTVFKITPAGVETVLHSFGNSDGLGPNAALALGSDGNFYGTTTSGPSLIGGKGTVFKITPSGVETVLHVFGDGTVQNDGVGPVGALAAGGDGNFYGTTSGGGSKAEYELGSGTVFKITPSGVETILRAFGDGTVQNDGQFPAAGPVLGSDGNFYGTNTGGGAYGIGTVFKVTPSGVETIISNFGNLQNSSYDPIAALVEGSDGNLYGTSYEGGYSAGANAFGYGTVYRISAGLSGNPPSSPTIGSISPASAAAGNAAFTLTVNGTGFISGATVDWNGTALQTTYVSAMHLTAIVPASLVATAGTASVTVVNPGVVASNALTFTITTPVATWTAAAVSAAPSGISHILWTRSDGAAGLWTLNAAGVQTAIGPVYGPYPGWNVKAVATANDGTSRVLWTNADGQAGVWTLNAADVETVIGPAYGPFTGWSAKAVGVAGDGTSHVLWTNTDGEAGLWTFGANDADIAVGPAYGPYTGWSAASLATGTSGLSQVLWTNTDGRACVWTFTAGDADTVIGETYGPYQGWTAKAVGTAGDGTARLLWTNTNGAAGLWSFAGYDIESLVGPAYGPYAGYTATALGVASDGTSRILWDDTSRAAGVWTFNASDVETVIGAVYGPF